jgi:hypothetical protein
VPLPGGSRESQTDLFALARTRGGLAAIAVEGKVAEWPGERVSEWIAPKRRRGRMWRRGQLSFLCQILGLDEREAGDLRYQLLYPTASAVFEADRFSAAYAVMLVHAFSPDADDAYEDFAAFARLLGGDPLRGLVTKTTAPSRATLFVGWSDGEAQYWHRPVLTAMLGLSFILTCAVCRRPWVSEDERWRAYHVGDDLDEPAEFVFYCPACAEREFGGE